ncbi:MAG: TonB-dependent receptor plug domain-containing protein [Acidobacteria bacterium]|nr:TonB-dependent receptor plug domain-containing protein [Acidobacteriota bacterium]
MKLFEPWRASRPSDAPVRSRALAASTRRPSKHLLGLCLLTLWSGSDLLAQSASLGGRVIDPSGAVVVGAEVGLTREEAGTKYRAHTVEQGVYTFPFLSPGRYRLEVSAEGFKRFERTEITVETAENAVIDVRLELGESTETVLVEGAGLSAGSADAAVSTVVDRQFVENLPLNGRSFHNLIAITPGVTQTPAGNWDPGQFSVNGQRTSSNYFTVDGVSANFGAQSGFWDSLADDGSLPAFSAAGGTNSLVSIDAMEEFKIQTSTYAPEYGRQPGGQIQIMTRSGGNDWTFTLFDYFRNDALDANDWFANRDGLARPAMRQNDFGGVVGGPVLLPGYDGRNRTFFFASYEGLRLRQPQFALDAYPTLETRESAAPGVRPLLDAYPIPNGADLGDGSARFSTTYSNPSTLDATSFRIDHHLGSRATLFGRFNNAPSAQEYRGGRPGYGPAPLSVVTTAFTDNRTLTLGSTQVLSPTVMNETRFNFSRSQAGQSAMADNFGGAVAPAASYLFPSFADPGQAGITILVPGYTGLTVGSISNRRQTQVNWVNNLSWVVGTHQMKMGADLRRMTPRFGYPPYGQLINFTGLTGAGGLTGGVPAAASINSRDTLRMGVLNFSAYVQDTWRATDRLTLTYGLRWEVNPAPKGLDGKPMYTIDQVDDPFAAKLAPVGTPLFETQYGNFAPRLGIAYQLRTSPGTETTLRAGAGLFYDIAQGAVYFAARNAPYRNQYYGPVSAFPIPESEAVVPAFDPAAPFGRIETFDPKFQLPRVTQFNVALEQAMGRNRSLTVTYAGAEGRRLARQLTFELSSAPSEFSRLAYYLSDATSSYHSLQVQFEQRLTDGLQMLLSHVYAHSIDDGSDVYNDGVIDASFSRPSPHVNRGDSDFDIRHAFGGAITYELPGPRRGGIAPLVRNWAVDSTIRLQTGAPVDIAQWSRNAFGTFYTRPDLVPGVPVYLEGDEYPGGRAFNRSAFVFGTGNVNGSLGRNALRAFPLRQVDFAVRRKFGFGERLNLQFRAEFFNVFNKPSFAAPVADPYSPFFGQATQMYGRGLGGGGGNGGLNPLYQSGGPRSVQLALKLQF